jgi:hypothetical protein
MSFKILIFFFTSVASFVCRLLIIVPALKAIYSFKFIAESMLCFFSSLNSKDKILLLQ